MSTYRAALIGVGAADSPDQKGGGHRIGYAHAASYGHDPRVDLVAAADINLANLEAFQNKFSVKHGYSDYRAMLEEVRPDVLSICTYVGLHHEMIVEAANAGIKAIYCEKPFVSTPARLHSIDRIIEATGVKLIIAHIRRYQPVFEEARRLYLGGGLGVPMLCVAGINDWDLSEWGSHWLAIFPCFKAIGSTCRWVSILKSTGGRLI